MASLIRFILYGLLLGAVAHSRAAPLTFNQALARAEAQSPRLAASRAAVDAAQQLANAADALPDPRFALGVDNYPVTGADADRLKRDFMTMQRVSVMQEVPNGAKRAARSAEAQAEISATYARHSAERLALYRDTAQAWLDLYYLQQQRGLLDALERENQLLKNLLTAQIAAGRAGLADAVSPRLEAAQLADRRDELARDLTRARSRLIQWVGADNLDEDDVVGGALPPLPLDAASLRTHLAQHPEMQEQAAQAQKAAAALAAARAEKRPDWGVELAYQRRAPQFGDMVSLQFTFTLPVSPATRQNPQIAARLREREAAEQRQEDLLRQHRNEMESDLAEAATLNNQLQRAQDTVLPLTEEKIALLLASYQAGKADIAAVLAARRERIEQLLRINELHFKRAVVAVRLIYAYGEDQP